MNEKYRSHYLGSLNSKQIDQTVTVSGWIKKKRNLGELIFVDLRDAKGYAQIIFTKDNLENYELINSLQTESVITVVGQVNARKEINSKIPSGEIEILATNLTLINMSKTSPMIIDDQTDALEDTRLKYRYLDLRRNPVIDKLRMRHKISLKIRTYLDSQDFIEIETPMLTKATPEGARDFLVPSRLNNKKFYALPQSPQIYKNLLMVGGVEKYYQIVKCFRDEDLRADRQPEFTQLDLEASFFEEKDVQILMEQLFIEMMSEIKGIDIPSDFASLTYNQAMNNYGLDKPDIRFDLQLNDLTNLFSNSDFKVFTESKTIKAIVLKDLADSYSRKTILELEEVVKKHNAKGLAWFKYTDNQLSGGISKFILEDEITKLETTLKLENNDLVLIIADEWDITCNALGNLRNYLGKKHQMYNQDEFKFVWINDWPLFEYDEEFKRYIAMHHPFTMPQNNKFEDDYLQTKARAYDLVLNGYEIGGGSVRINDRAIQQKMFELLGMDQAEIDSKFSFYLDAYEYGAPVHAGIAFGLDRIAMILSGGESIRDVIAFPKNASAKEVMMDSPTEVSSSQLKELGIKLD